MPKYTEAAGTIIDRRWLKRIANETAETNRLLRKLIDNSTRIDSPLTDDAGDDP